MCTCFVNRGNDLIIAMNFDNNGMPFELNTNTKKAFVVDINTNIGKQPSFGINTEKTFISNLCVDSNGKGLYKRVGKTRTLTAYLVKDLLEGKLKINDLDNYLENIEVVNAPNLCTHNFIADKKGNVWVVEPGRGNLKNKTNESPYYIMTNFSLVDYNAGKIYSDNSFDRYMKVKNYLDKNKNLSVKKAFDILEKVKQTGEWNTDFSFVYSKNDNKVYYCYNSDYKNILEYKL
ncbi:hypothetical protein AGMMS49546_13120 [Spirochaetia bacterium]|nr:hypothetical protein AGMMS49546_13120 [Spirochaetia bacterium]